LNNYGQGRTGQITACGDVQQNVVEAGSPAFLKRGGSHLNIF